MIEDRTRPPRPTPRDWAVFRYGLISEATRPLAHEVVSQTLDDHIALINNLNALKISGIIVQNEDRNDRGQIVSEISLTYERLD